jgi:hypothetical protein
MKPDIFTTAWRTTYGVISGNVPDPGSRNKHWIFSANPLIGSDFGKLTFPIIIIEPFTVSNGKPLTWGDETIETELATTIEIFDSSAGSRLDNLAGSMYNVLWSKLNDFESSGLGFMVLTGGGYQHIPISRDNRIHIRSFGLGFKTK